MNYHCGIAQDLTCYHSYLLSLSIIWINVSFIMKLMFPLPPYHTIYLLIKLFWINFILIRLEDVLSPLDLSLTPPQLLHKFLTSSLTWLPFKYYNKTHVFSNITNLASVFNANLLEFLTFNHVTEVLKLWLPTFVDEKN
jgi:hypothetical protein